MANIGRLHYKIIPFALMLLPFTKALTIDIGFPLKIYEILLVACLLFFLIGKIRIINTAIVVYILLTIFAAVTTITSIYCTIYPATGYFYDDTISRFGAISSIFTKVIYLIFLSNCFYMLTDFAAADCAKYYRYWMYGAFICLFYTYYLFISSILGFEPFLLPGMTEVQMLNFKGLSVIRSGTFEEGNFLGLYLLLSTILAVHNSNYKLAALFSSTMLIIFSTINIAALLIYLLLVMKNNLARISLVKRIKLIGLAAIVISTITVTMYVTDYIDVVIYDKLTSPSGSAADRFDQLVTGLRMFIDNPMIGVGHDNYGYYYRYYQYTSMFDMFHQGKMIANNVYVELLAETGIVGLILFMSVFIYMFYRFSKEADVEFFGLKYGVYCIVFVFIAYPSFIVMFIWAFLAYVVAQYSVLQKRKADNFAQDIY
jgi:O-antigen ligase